MKKCYYIVPLDKVRSISNTGLVPNGKSNNKLINSSEGKINFSEGMTGVIAKYANCQKHYDLIKSGVVGGIDQAIVDKVQATESMQEYLGEVVYIIFEEDIENQKNFMDGETDKPIDLEKLNICLLKNNETGEVAYAGEKIVHYMMSKVPVETINYSGSDIPEENKEKRTQDIRQDVLKYVKNHEQVINTYKLGDYTLENIPIKSFCMQYLFQQGDSMSGQSIGKATMDLLKDINAVREMEAQLDKAVRELVQYRDTAEPDHTLIPKERQERKQDN